MSKYTIEVPDDEIDDFLSDLVGGLGGRRAERIAAEMEDQKPSLPLPTRKQAVVRVPRGIAIKADTADKTTTWSWMIATNDGSYDWVVDPGKVLEIIYPGAE